jgi:hypothetical protein
MGNFYADRMFLNFVVAVACQILYARNYGNCLIYKIITYIVLTRISYYIKNSSMPPKSFTSKSFNKLFTLSQIHSYFKHKVLRRVNLLSPKVLLLLSSFKSQFQSLKFSSLLCEIDLYSYKININYRLKSE